MKKYILKSIVVLAFIPFLTACEDFLDIYNPSAITDDFYDTKTGQERLLADTYSRFRSVYNTGELQYYGTDLYMAITEGPNERMFNGYDQSFNSTAGVVGGYWSNLYKIVQQSNILLNRASPEIEGMSESDYTSMTAQSRFLRVLAYYYLVETFGPVPLLTMEEDDIITEVARTSEADVYAFMIEELEAIKDALPWAASQPGRVSKGAVMHLLGKLYLTRAYKSFAQEGDFGTAAQTFDAVINDSGNSYELLDDFADVFDEFNQNNAEVIWSVQYGTDLEYAGGGNPQQALFSFNITALNPDLFEKVQDDYSFAQRNYWVNPRVHELFTDPMTDARYDATFLREIYVNNPASDNLGQLGMYFPRWNDTSGNDNGALLFYPFKDGGEYVWYPQSTATDVLRNGSDRMPMIKKFKDTQMLWGGSGTREDVIFRLADTYLLSAEAHLGNANTQASLNRLNTIRRRAAATPAMENQMELNAVNIDVILDERARELLGEHDRWFDLKRTGKLIERAYAWNILVQKYDNLNEDHLLRPIPQDEINKLKGLTQNPGY
jgi:hypothetical protein